MISATQKTSSMRELAHRVTDGIDVTLYWHPDTNELTVCVFDRLRGTYFEIEPEAARALDAFYHPYSYASLDSEQYAFRAADR